MTGKILDLIPVKRSHISRYDNFPLYYISKTKEPVLFKKPEHKIDSAAEGDHPYQELYIRREDEATVVQSLMTTLNMQLAKDISSKGIQAIRQSICLILEEALEGPMDTTLKTLPETLEILFFNARRTPGFLDALVKINSNSPKVIEHSINVLAITAQYCFFKDLDDDELRKFGLCALLHDAGTARINKAILETDEKLTDEEFMIFKTHTTKGYKDIKAHSVFDRGVARTVLEHHERLDGSGYPDGITNISFEAQAIGLIDSYEPLKYRDKNFRKAMKPYDALQIIKQDVLQGKYNKQVFIDLCSCLIK